MNGKICSVGEVMLECIHSMPIKNTTVITSGETLALGGPAINLSWNLKCLGWDPQTLCTIGTEYQDRLMRIFAAGNLNPSGIQLMGHGVDTLVVFTEPTSHYSVYYKFAIEHEVIDKIRKEIEKAESVILNGSRHSNLQDLYLSLSSRDKVKNVIFNPGYTIYSYDPRVLVSLLKKVNVFVLNQNESDYLMSLGYDYTKDDDLSNTVVIKTMAHDGSTILHQSKTYKFGSATKISDDVIGTGDGYLAAFIHRFFKYNSPIEECGLFATCIAAQVAESRNIRTTINESLALEQMKSME